MMGLWLRWSFIKGWHSQAWRRNHILSNSSSFLKIKGGNVSSVSLLMSSDGCGECFHCTTRCYSCQTGLWATRSILSPFGLPGCIWGNMCKKSCWRLPITHFFLRTLFWAWNQDINRKGCLHLICICRSKGIQILCSSKASTVKCLNPKLYLRFLWCLSVVFLRFYPDYFNSQSII